MKETIKDKLSRKIVRSGIDLINNNLKNKGINYLIKYPEEYFIEPSLNCLRLSIHKKEKEVFIFLEDKDISKELESFIEEIKRLSENDFILDGGIMLKNHELSYSGLKNLVLDRKLNIDNSIIYLWDCLYLKEPIFNKELSHRKGELSNLNVNDKIKLLDSSLISEINLGNLSTKSLKDNKFILKPINGKYLDNDWKEINV